MRTARPAAHQALLVDGDDMVVVRKRAMDAGLKLPSPTVSMAASKSMEHTSSSTRRTGSQIDDQPQSTALARPKCNVQVLRALPERWIIRTRLLVWSLPCSPPMPRTHNTSRPHPLIGSLHPAVFLRPSWLCSAYGVRVCPDNPSSLARCAVPGSLNHTVELI